MSYTHNELHIGDVMYCASCFDGYWLAEISSISDTSVTLIFVRVPREFPSWLHREVHSSVPLSGFERVYANV